MNFLFLNALTITTFTTDVDNNIHKNNKYDYNNDEDDYYDKDINNSMMMMMVVMMILIGLMLINGM